MLQQINDPKDQMDDFLIDHHSKKIKPKFFKLFFIALAIVFFVILILVVPILFQGIKISKAAIDANSQLDVIIEEAKKGNWLELSNGLNHINQDVDDINDSLGGLGLIYYWPNIRKSVDVSRQILSSTSNLISGYQEVFSLLSKIEDDLGIDSLALNFSDESGRQNLLKAISDHQEELLVIKNNIDQARNEIKNINTGDYTGAFKEQLLLADDILNKAIDNTETVFPILINLPDLMGYQDEKTYLFVFQNNMELRPTGGFIGSYGLIKIKNGEIVDISTDDIYNLDKHSIGKLNALAPEPMKKYNAQEFWYLRDANWSPDWPTSAEKIIWFFNEERKNAGLSYQALDGVIAINPDFISNLIEVVGPIAAHGLTFESENFANDLEMFVEFDYVDHGIAKENRKDIIGILTNTLVDSVYSASHQDLLNIWLAFKKNIDEKNILVYLTDKDLQSYFDNKNWSGEVKNVDSDYLMIVDSNLAALKTDQMMDREINRGLKIGQDGNLLATVSITYHHLGEKLTNLITRYRTYVRVYVTEDTWFDRAYIQYQGKNTNLDFDKDVSFGQELNKKYLATFLVIEPGDSKTLVLEYKLSEKIKTQYKNGLYKLLIQKQPGTAGHDLKLYLDFDQEVRSYHADNLPQEFNKNSIFWDSDLSVDREYLINF